MDSEAAKQPTKSSPKNGPSDLVDSMSKINLDDENEKGHHTHYKRNIEQPSRRLVIYPRPQALKLSKSPLVKPPEGMPALKDWFGAENEQSMHKKDGEGSSPTGPRDRRFRRDPDDGDTPPRPSFRGTLTQPSQMGNFKHQSLRSTDRGDREKDGDKERERDARDKEGQERLRNLSDKYDRDRQALPSNLTNLRNKERDSAPHLSVGSSRAAREIPPSAASRRTEPREGSKKKTEASEDWRRGADPHRPGRDDRSENLRKDRDRDDRDRPRSRVRDNSRQRRERSSSRRDRDRSDRDRDRDRDRRGDGDRDDYRRDREDYRRERDDYLRRDRDLEKDVEADDPRRWRDDGKRDERTAARREREYRERVRERPSREEGWEPPIDRHGGRWTVVEERDGRNKRSSGRDRRSGVLDDGKEKDDRKDRDRDKEREKEPAWMDTYIPVDSALGGEDELDGIQAFKKDMKAKEQKDMPSSTADDAARSSGSSKAESAPPLDEIQLFKLMMKKEQEQKVPEGPHVPISEPISTGPTVYEVGNGAPGHARIKEQHQISPISNGESAASEPRSALDQSTPTILPISSSSVPPVAEPASRTNSNAPHALLSILSSTNNGVRPAALPTPNLTPSLDTALSKPTGSRFFPKPLPSDASSPVTLDQGSSSSQAPPQFNPPPGSRLLAFGARNTSSASGPQNTNNPPLQTSHSMHSSIQQHHAFQSPSDAFQGAGSSLPQSDISHRPAVSESMRAQRGFSPFELQSRTTFAFDESREPGNYGQNADSLRRTPVASPADRALLSVTSDSNTGNNYFNANSDSFTVNGPGPSFDPTNNGLQYTSGKGSRFLKYFEDKGRDSQTGGTRKPQGPIGFQSASPNLNQRQEQGGFNGMLGNGDNRSVDALVAMLSTSAQGQRGSTVNQMGPGVTPGGHFGQHNNLQSLHHQHQMHHQQQLPPNNRLDSLYDSRLDDRNFVPDGMVPGLRQAAPSRSRESNGMFADPMDDPMQFNPHRLAPQQRGLDHSIFPSGVPSMYAQQGGLGRNAGIPLQQPQFRGNTPPNPLQGAQQRLPRGLANLGARPPHEPSQFVGSSHGMQQSGGIHGPVHGNGPSPQPFTNFSANGNLGGNLGGGLGGFAGNLQMRGPPPAHQIPNSLAHNQMGHPSGTMDVRGPTNQAQLLSLGGGPNIGGLRGTGGGFGPPGPPGQMQTPLLAMRQQQQQQQHLPPHMMPHPGHQIPPHLQQPVPPGSNTQDLMALLMGGHRE